MPFEQPPDQHLHPPLLLFTVGEFEERGVGTFLQSAGSPWFQTRPCGSGECWAVETDLKAFFLCLAFVVPEKDLALELLIVQTASLPI